MGLDIVFIVFCEFKLNADYLSENLSFPYQQRFLQYDECTKLCVGCRNCA